MRYAVRAAVVVLALAWSVPAAAATFTVTKVADTADGACDADCSLREAIIAANAAAGADTVVVPAGTYTLTIPGAGENASATGDLDVTGALTISGAGSGTTTINGGGLDRVLDASLTSLPLPSPASRSPEARWGLPKREAASTIPPGR